MVIWIAGLSRSGKTTLCTELVRLLKPRLPQLVVLDGDEIRRVFDDALGHSEPDRITQIGRIQRLAAVLAGQQLVVLVAALYVNPELLAWNRANLPGYFEVYLRAPLDLLRARDTDSLYRRAFEKTIANVVGVDIPWQEPSSPDLVLDAGIDVPPSVLARSVIESVPLLTRACSRV